MVLYKTHSERNIQNRKKIFVPFSQTGFIANKKKEKKKKRKKERKKKKSDIWTLKIKKKTYIFDSCEG